MLLLLVNNIDVPARVSSHFNGLNNIHTQKGSLRDANIGDLINQFHDAAKIDNNVLQNKQKQNRMKIIQ